MVIATGCCFEVVDKLITVGGRKSVLKPDHWCGQHNISHAHRFGMLSWSVDPQHRIEIVHRLIEVGRQKLVLTTDLQRRQTALQLECLKENPCPEIVDRLMEVGDEKLHNLITTN